MVNSEEIKKILLVDDEPDILDLLRSILTLIPNKKQIQLFTATNGKEAISAVKEIKPDLILLDLIMPVMDGFEVCEKIKSDRELSKIPIVLVSAYTSDINVERGEHCGAEQFIKKPFKIKDIANLVEKYLP